MDSAINPVVTKFTLYTSKLCMGGSENIKSHRFKEIVRVSFHKDIDWCNVSIGTVYEYTMRGWMAASGL